MEINNIEYVWKVVLLEWSGVKPYLRGQVFDSSHMGAAHFWDVREGRKWDSS